MSNKKKKGHKTMRKPPTDPDLDSWVSGDDSTATKKTTSSQTNSSASDNSGPQVTNNSTDTTPSGTGIVERADGTYRRRMVVYLSTEHAKALKVHAALNDRNMSEIVDDLIGDWISSNNS